MAVADRLGDERVELVLGEAEPLVGSEPNAPYALPEDPVLRAAAAYEAIRPIPRPAVGREAGQNERVVESPSGNPTTRSRISCCGLDSVAHQDQELPAVPEGRRGDVQVALDLAVDGAGDELAAADLVSCIFTLTEDLDAEFPAVAARNMGLSKVPLLCAREAILRMGKGAQARETLGLGAAAVERAVLARCPQVVLER